MHSCVCMGYMLVCVCKQSLEKVQLEFEIRIQFCIMCPLKFLNLCAKWVNECKILKI